MPAVSARCTLIKETLVTVSVCSCNERQETHHSPMTSPMERAATLAPAASTRRRQMVSSMVFCHQNIPPEQDRTEGTNQQQTHNAAVPEARGSASASGCFRPRWDRVLTNLPQSPVFSSVFVSVFLALEHLIGQSNQILAVAPYVADTGGKAPAADLHCLCV